MILIKALAKRACIWVIYYLTFNGVPILMIIFGDVDDTEKPTARGILFIFGIIAAIISHIWMIFKLSGAEDFGPLYPLELWNHIKKYCNNLVQEERAKIPKPKTPLEIIEEIDRLKKELEEQA